MDLRGGAERVRDFGRVHGKGERHAGRQGGEYYVG